MKGTTTANDGADIEENGKIPEDMILNAKTVGGKMKTRMMATIALPQGTIPHQIGNILLHVSTEVDRIKQLILPLRYHYGPLCDPSCRDVGLW